jgi:N-acetylmuramoyl-L-alanine amidase
VLLGNGPAGLRFEPGSRKLAVSGILIWMNASCLARGRDWTIAGCDAARIVDPLLRPRQVLASQRVRTVVLDPGHGGQDQGAAGARRVLEKKVVLDIARRVRSRLQACGVGVKLTRPKDETLALGARTAAAAAWGADVLVSIHLNSARNRDARGVETYVIASEGFASTAAARGDLRPCPGNDHEAASTVLAYFVHKGVLAQTRTPDRGIKHARFEILRSAPCPAALIECGFVSNPTDEARLIEARHRDAIAEGIARGILTYINRTGG